MLQNEIRSELVLRFRLPHSPETKKILCILGWILFVILLCVLVLFMNFFVRKTIW